MDVNSTSTEPANTSKLDNKGIALLMLASLFPTGCASQAMSRSGVDAIAQEYQEASLELSQLTDSALNDSFSLAQLSSYNLREASEVGYQALSAVKKILEECQFENSDGSFLSGPLLYEERDGIEFKLDRITVEPDSRSISVYAKRAFEITDTEQYRKLEQEAKESREYFVKVIRAVAQRLSELSKNETFDTVSTEILVDLVVQLPILSNRLEDQELLPSENILHYRHKTGNTSELTGHTQYFDESISALNFLRTTTLE